MAQAAYAVCALDSSTNCAIKHKLEVKYKCEELRRLRGTATPPQRNVLHRIRQLDLANHQENDSNLQNGKAKEWRRNRRAPQGKRVQFTAKYSVINWNIEGFTNAIRSAPARDLFAKADVVCLTETFAYYKVNLQGYYTFSIDACKAERGRPSGGLCILAKPRMQPKIHRGSEKCIAIDTVIGKIFCFYFKPDTDIQDITQCLTEHLANCSGKIMINGDFNCRVDNDNPRGSQLLQTMRQLGYELVSNAREYTYIAHNGRSSIDLSFTNYGTMTKIICSKVLHNPIRKHQRVLTTFRVKNSPARGDKNQLETRRVFSIEQFLMHPKVRLLNGISVNEVATLTQIIENSKIDNARIKHPNKPWFDGDCKDAKYKCYRLYKNNDITEYARARREYRNLIKTKRYAYEECNIILKLQEAVGKPWIMFSKPNSFANHIQGDHWKDHFSKLLTQQKHNLPPKDLNTNYEQWYNEEITEQELYEAVRTLKRRKAPGLDNIINEEILILYPYLATWWLQIFNLILESAEIPEPWMTAKVKTLYKGKGELKDPNCYRGIALLSTQLKLLTKLINSKIMSQIENKLPREQYGFRRNLGCEDALNKLTLEINAAMSQPRGKLYAAFIDFKKAFDSVDRELLCNKLLEHGIKGKVYNLIRELLKTNYIKIDNGKELTRKIAQEQGVLQGDSLSPTLFLIFVMDLPESIKVAGSHSIMYADDLVIYSDKLESLQESLDKLEIWCNCNKLAVNPEKCRIMKFRKGGRLKESDKAYLGPHELEITNEYEYLGVTLQTTLSLTKHINKKSRKMAQVIGSQKHLQKVSMEVAEKIFNIMIWPAITYGLKPLSHVITAKHLLAMDRIKARFYKKALGLPKNSSNTFTFILADTKSMGECLINNLVGITRRTKLEYEELREMKNWDFVAGKFTDGPAFNCSSWKCYNQKNRHFLSCLTWHGYHHLTCKNRSFHEPEEDCQCRRCNAEAGRYHILACTERGEQSISSYITQLTNEMNQTSV